MARGKPSKGGKNAINIHIDQKMQVQYFMA